MRRKVALLMCGWSILELTTIMWTGTGAWAWAQQEEGKTAGLSGARIDGLGASENGKGRVGQDEAGNFLRAPKETSSTTFSGLARNLAEDQKGIWTSPGRIRFEDATWLAPLAGVTAGFFVTDRDVSGHLAQDIKTQQHYRKVGTGGSLALVGVGGGLALWSTISRDEHQRETGFLAGEAAIDSFLVAEALKYGLQRARPYQSDGAGQFFHSGASFPSEHAAAALSLAGIIRAAHSVRLAMRLRYRLGTP